ncbi:MAG: DNA-binding protein [Chloroflexi bacterium]|jgi:excisionase family DNA binding protein|nr:DNA-binding protein [Chloroflexota bacterium]
MSESPVEVNDGFIDGNEVCRLLGVKPATLYAYVSRGVLKSYKQGIKRQRLYKRDAVLKLLAVRPSDEVSEIPAQAPKVNRKADIPAAEDWIPYF